MGREKGENSDAEYLSEVVYYNKCMGRADLMNSLISLYRVNICMNKYYHHLVSYIFTKQ
jgi:hypothetical protein